MCKFASFVLTRDRERHGTGDWYQCRECANWVSRERMESDDPDAASATLCGRCIALEHEREHENGTRCACGSTAHVEACGECGGGVCAVCWRICEGCTQPACPECRKQLPGGLWSHEQCLEDRS